MPRPALAWLASGTAVGLLILGYLAAHLAVRLLTSPTLGLDDAEQALLAQRFAWGYQLRQPPLYTWLVLPAFQVLGVNLLALSLVRTLLLGLTYGLLYGVARRWIADRRLAALALLSFSAIYLFGYYAHHDLTHSTALAAAVAASLYAFARLVERPSALAYLALGLCFGLGLLAKWNFVMLALGLPLTCLLHRRLRPLVLDPKVLLALAAMVLVATPAVLWVLAQEHSALATAGAVLGERPERGFWRTLGAGSAALAKATLVWPLPFLVLFLPTFGSALRRARATSGDAAPSAVTPGFLGSLIAVVLALHWLLIPSAGAVAFTEHWLHPALMVLPIWLFALAGRGAPTPRACRAWLVLLGLVALAALGARILHYALGADHCGRCRDLVPFGALAAELRAAGFQQGTIVAGDFHIGGNLRLAFPASRVLVPGLPLSIWPPPAGHGQCLAVWPTGGAGPAAWLADALGVAPESARRTGRVAAPMIGSQTRTFALRYALLPEGAGACR